MTSAPHLVLQYRSKNLARDLGVDARTVEASTDELRCSMAEWAGLNS